MLLWTRLAGVFDRDAVSRRSLVSTKSVGQVSARQRCAGTDLEEARRDMEGRRVCSTSFKRCSLSVSLSKHVFFLNYDVCFQDRGEE